MDKFSRTDTSVLGNWWWNIDKWLFACLWALIIIGIVLLFSASPEVASHIKKAPNFFIKKQFLFLPMAIMTIAFFSFLNEKYLKILASLLFFISLVLMVMVIFKGYDIKGARRWISIFGITIQPSEFLKPSFAVVCAILFNIGTIANFKIKNHLIAIKGWMFALLSLIVCVLLLLNQPDFGMTMTVCFIFFTEVFILGTSLKLLSILGIGFTSIVFFAYTLIPHVKSRIDSFINPEVGDNYQVKVALEAFKNGGFFGRGLGKSTGYVPDSHTDFILAIAAEQFGLFLALIILLLYGMIIIRSIRNIYYKNNRFAIVAVIGLLTQLGVQSLINMASTLGIIPPKGMTLPLISYGGSSLISTGILMGMILALCSKKEENTL